MNWIAIEGEELARIRRCIDDGQGLACNQLFASRLGLPFYRDGHLLCVETEDSKGFAVETGDGSLVPMNGTGMQLKHANECAGLQLTPDNVLAYAEFFCYFLECANGYKFALVTRRGPWTLESGNVPSDLTPRIAAYDEAGNFTINAHMSHRGVLLEVTLEVESDGVVRMTDDNPLGPIVALQ